MNTKNNRQFQDSDARMKRAMLELMNTMPFEKITVRLICSMAQVNRSTFYAHYADIYDMIRQMEASLQKELLDSYPVSRQVTALSPESFLPFLKFIREHQDFYRVALKTSCEFPRSEKLTKLWEQVMKPLCVQAGISSEEEMLFYFIGFQAGFTMILRHWVERGCIEQEEQLSRIIQNIIPAVWKRA